jgi:hypothetical protein
MKRVSPPLSAFHFLLSTICFSIGWRMGASAFFLFLPPYQHQSRFALIAYDPLLNNLKVLFLNYMYVKQFSDIRTAQDTACHYLSLPRPVDPKNEVDPRKDSFNKDVDYYRSDF